MKDLISHVAPALMIGPATLAADNTPTAQDLQGFRSALIALAVGAGGITFDATNKIEFKLTHSDDNSSYTDVADADVKILKEDGTAGTVATGGIVLALTAAHATAGVTRIGYKGTKRYLKLLADFSGTHGTGTPIAAVLIRGDADRSPVA